MMLQRNKVAAGVVVAVALGLVGYGIWGRKHQLAALERVAVEQSVPSVEIITPSPGPAARPLVLPGTVRAWYEAPIFAQVSGYVRSWDKDYGATVKAGEVLAEIETPSLDAQFAAAKANLAVAQANYHLAVATAARWQALADTPAVSKQEVDVQVAGAEARKAELEVATQNVARYAALESFKRVVAPFDGVVIARLTDVGDYVNAAGGDAGARTNSTQLFTVADVHRMRVFVQMPQSYAGALAPGVEAMLYLPMQSAAPTRASFLTTARAYSVNTRTSVTELMVENPDGKLWPGTYVDVHFQVPSDPRVVTIPEQALIFDAEGIQVAAVDAQNRVALRRVTLGYNLGQSIQVTSGIEATDRLVNNPPAGLLSGQSVRPVAPASGYSRSTASAALSPAVRSPANARREGGL